MTTLDKLNRFIELKCQALPNGCTVFTGVGPATITDDGFTRPVVRVMYDNTVGLGNPLPHGARLRNQCGNRKCVTVSHWAPAQHKVYQKQVIVIPPAMIARAEAKKRGDDMYKDPANDRWYHV